MPRHYVRVELFYRHTESGVTKYAWLPQLEPDGTAAVYARDSISMSPGRSPQQTEPASGSGSLTFKGHTHNPRNPASPLYGLIGENTPIRILVGDKPVLTDTFTRTTVDGWGGPGALAWVLAGGTVPDDYDVNGSEGTHTLSTTSVRRTSLVDTGATDHLVRAIWDWSVDDLTGGSVIVSLCARAVDASNCYRLDVTYDTGEQVTASLVRVVAGSAFPVATWSGSINLLGVAGSDVYGELVVEGGRLYGKVWRRFGGVDEPIAYLVSGVDGTHTAGTSAGVSSFRSSANTNANLQARFHDFTVVPGTVRYAGYVKRWQPMRDKGGDTWVVAELHDALGVLEKAEPLRSALWRENLFGGPLAMWPITDGKNAAIAASALPGGTPMSITSRDFVTGVLVSLSWEPVAYNEWVEPIGTPALDTQLTFIAPIAMGSAATEWAVDFAFTATADTAASGGALVLLQNGGRRTASDPLIEWILAFTNGQWELDHRLWTGDTSVVTTVIGSGAVAYQDGRIHYARITTTRVGSDVDWEVWLDGLLLGSGTQTLDWEPLAVFQGATGTGTAGQTSMGFVTVWDTATPPFNSFNAAVVGRAGELAGNRLARLCGEEGIPFEALGTADAPMGPQLIDTLAANAAAVEAVDMGLLHGTRHQPGLTYRARVSLYNQSPVTLDAAAGGEVDDPLNPEIGDLGLANDVTVHRPGGSFARSVQDSGPLNVLPPPAGVGRYAPPDLDAHVDGDDQLQPIADWRRQKGTQGKIRYPEVTVNFDALAAAGKGVLAAAVARLRVGDRLDVANLEAAGVSQVAPGYTETVGPFDARRIAFHAEPAAIYDIGVYNDAQSRYDSGYSTTVAQITTGTSTSLSVAVAAGRVLWVTGSTGPLFPFDIDLAGARVRVTAISGATSPQTFTLSTTVVNGIAKVIPAGTPVRIWAPRRYGL